MMIKFTKPITCFPEKNKSDLQCGNNMMIKLEKKFGIKLHADSVDEKVNGHFSCKHTNGKHIVWVFLYDSSGIHQSIRGDKMIEQKSNRIIKFNGTFPTEKEIKNAL